MNIKNTVYALGMFGLASLVGCDGFTDETQLRGGDLYDTKTESVREIDWNKKSIMFIIDTSGSMADEINGERKIDLAKASLLNILEQYKKHDDVNNDLEAGVLYFDRNTVCELVRLQDFEYAQLRTNVEKLGTPGGTPLGIALAYAERQLDEYGNGRKNIILLTDGINTVGRNPDEVYEQILKANNETGDVSTQVYVIAFATDENNFEGLKNQGAVVKSAKDGQELSDVLEQDKDLILEKVN